MNFSPKNCLSLIFLLSLKCQILMGQNRIIGGEESVIEKFPYLVRLNIGRRTGNIRNVCGASIIGREWVITAAHCFDHPEVDFNKLTIIAGSTNIRDLQNTSQTVNVTTVIRHELYEGLVANNKADIAALKVTPPFHFSQAVKPVKLPERGRPLRINYGIVSGWGHTYVGGITSVNLRYVIVPRIDPVTCQRKYDIRRIKLHEEEICYGFSNGTLLLDKCNGDSGGPLVNLDEILIGIISWGIDCGTKGFPGIYTSVAMFRDWIKTTTGI